MVSTATLRYLVKIRKQKQWKKGAITEDVKYLPEKVGQGLTALRYALIFQ